MLNRTAVEQNLQAFRYGRLYRYDPERIEATISPSPPGPAELAEREGGGLGSLRPAYEALLERCAGLDSETRRLLAIRVAELIRYQDPDYAAQYLDFVLDVWGRESRALGEGAEYRVTREVVRNLYKLMAYKDEYEVARLHLRAGMRHRAEATWTGRVRIHYHLHPPFLRALGVKRKLRLGRWFEPVFWMLVRLRKLRGTRFDPFGRARVRRVERELIGWYAGLIDQALEHLRPHNQRQVAELARLPEAIRGYEQIKLDSVDRARSRAEILLREISGDTRSLPVLS